MWSVKANVGVPSDNVGCKTGMGPGGKMPPSMAGGTPAATADVGSVAFRRIMAELKLPLVPGLDYKSGMDSELSGKVVLITGASGGIGSALARKFANEGARLILHFNSNRARAEALAD